MRSGVLIVCVCLGLVSAASGNGSIPNPLATTTTIANGASQPTTTVSRSGTTRTTRSLLPGFNFTLPNMNYSLPFVPTRMAAASTSVGVFTDVGNLVDFVRGELTTTVEESTEANGDVRVEASAGNSGKAIDIRSRTRANTAGDSGAVFVGVTAVTTEEVGRNVSFDNSNAVVTNNTVVEVDVSLTVTSSRLVFDDRANVTFEGNNRVSGSGSFFVDGAVVNGRAGAEIDIAVPVATIRNAHFIDVAATGSTNGPSRFEFGANTVGVFSGKANQIETRVDFAAGSEAYLADGYLSVFGKGRFDVAGDLVVGNARFSVEGTGTSSARNVRVENSFFVAGNGKIEFTDVSVDAGAKISFAGDKAGVSGKLALGADSTVNFDAAIDGSVVLNVLEATKRESGRATNTTLRIADDASTNAMAAVNQLVTRLRNARFDAAINVSATATAKFDNVVVSKSLVIFVESPRENNMRPAYNRVEANDSVVVLGYVRVNNLNAHRSVLHFNWSTEAPVTEYAVDARGGAAVLTDVTFNVDTIPGSIEEKVRLMLLPVGAEVSGLVGKIGGQASTVRFKGEAVVELTTRAAATTVSRSMTTAAATTTTAARKRALLDASEWEYYYDPDSGQLSLQARGASDDDDPSAGSTVAVSYFALCVAALAAWVR